MAGHLKVVELPGSSLADIPASLRQLADNIEAGECGDCHNLVYVMDKGDDGMAVGLLGQCATPGVLAYYMLGLGMKHLMSY